MPLALLLTALGASRPVSCQARILFFVALAVGSASRVRTLRNRRVASYSILELLEARPDYEEDHDLEGDDVVNEASIRSTEERSFSTIAEVMAWARTKVAEIAGATTEAVKLDLKIEY